LGGVDNQQRTFARSERAADLVAKIDVAGRVDEVEHVPLAVVGLVIHARGLQLDRDAALALDIHGVEQLSLHLAILDRLRGLQQAISERRFAVVNVCYDAKVAYPRRVINAVAAVVLVLLVYLARLACFGDHVYSGGRSSWARDAERSRPQRAYLKRVRGVQH